MTTPTIGILETGGPPDTLIGRFGDYPTMVRRWLDLPQARFVSYPAFDGILPDDPREADLWVITGSRFGVLDDRAWIAPLEAFVRRVRDAGGIMLGICFGHQLIAKALGGEVAKSDRGVLLAVQSYTPTGWPAALGPQPATLRLQAYHLDQVTCPPEGARTIATSATCKHAALWYPGFALSVQGHPEFGPDYMRALLNARRGDTLPIALADAALPQVDAPTTRKDLAALVRARLLRPAEKGPRHDR